MTPVRHIGLPESPMYRLDPVRGQRVIFWSQGVAIFLSDAGQQFADRTGRPGVVIECRIAGGLLGGFSEPTRGATA